MWAVVCSCPCRHFYFCACFPFVQAVWPFRKIGLLLYLKHMKRITAIFIAILYVALTSGFTVNVHYCMGRLASIGLQSVPDNKCNKCGKSGKSGHCCKDEFKYCKVTETHQHAKVLQHTASSAIDLQLPVKTIMAVPGIPAIAILSLYDHHDPPDPGEVPLFLRHCIFLI